jgi:hypothetical protein
VSHVTHVLHTLRQQSLRDASTAGDQDRVGHCGLEHLERFQQRRRVIGDGAPQKDDVRALALREGRQRRDREVPAEVPDVEADGPQHKLGHEQSCGVPFRCGRRQQHLAPLAAGLESLELWGDAREEPVQGARGQVLVGDGDHVALPQRSDVVHGRRHDLVENVQRSDRRDRLVDDMVARPRSPATNAARTATAPAFGLRPACPHTIGSDRRARKPADGRADDLGVSARYRRTSVVHEQLAVRLGSNRGRRQVTRATKWRQSKVRRDPRMGWPGGQGAEPVVAEATVPRSRIVGQIRPAPGALAA